MSLRNIINNYLGEDQHITNPIYGYETIVDALNEFDNPTYFAIIKRSIPEKINERFLNIFKHRAGITEKKTLRKLGIEENITHERIRQIYGKMKHDILKESDRIEADATKYHELKILRGEYGVEERNILYEQKNKSKGYLGNLNDLIGIPRDNLYELRHEGIDNLKTIFEFDDKTISKKIKTKPSKIKKLRRFYETEIEPFTVPESGYNPLERQKQLELYFKNLVDTNFIDVKYYLK